MYDTQGVLPVDGLPGGTQLLVSGPPLVGGRRLAQRVLARGLDRGEAGLVVTTDKSPASVRSEIAALTAESDSVSRLGVVACLEGGETYDEDGQLWTASSPADLTGIGIGISEAVKAAQAAGYDKIRVVFDSLSSLLVYSDFERVFRFCHVFNRWIERLDGITLAHIQSDTAQDQVAQLEGVFDGVLDFREQAGTIEYRLRGLPDASEAWIETRDDTQNPADPPGSSAGATTESGSTAEASPADRDAGGLPETGDTAVHPGDDQAAPRGETGRSSDSLAEGEQAVNSVESLHQLITDVENEALTLTICNPKDSSGIDQDLTAYFDQLNVGVRTADLPTATPQNVAILHRGREPLAMSALETLQNAIHIEAIEGTTNPTAVSEATPDVIERANRREYSVENGGKLQMVRISRLIETRALDTGRGALHTGFQRLTRVRDELGTQDIYERIAEAGVETHVYGQPGEVPNAEYYTVHADNTPEIAQSWFVVYDVDTSSQAGALVSEETGDERYSGFWTYRSDIVNAATGYLRETYPTA